MQFVELRADLAPDARFFRRVLDERRAEALQPVLAAQGEQLLAPSRRSPRRPGPGWPGSSSSSVTSGGVTIAWASMTGRTRRAYSAIFHDRASPSGEEGGVQLFYRSDYTRR